MQETDGIIGGIYMCGRFLLNSEIDEIVNKYKIYYKEAGKYNLGDFYPSQDAAIVLDNNKRVITLAKWGFHNNAKRKVVINARVETIMNRPMFKNSFYSARCIIPANMFYEWKDEGNRKKVKYKIGLQDNNLISLGGIYKVSLDENLKEHLTFVIITTEADGDIKEIHSQMPLIINDEELDLWLNNNTSLRLVEEILRSNGNYKFTIEKCEDESIESTNGEHYEQIKMF